MILYRPVGLQELALIYDSGMKAFPARLPQQPIFYPVLQLDYARQTASGWNAQNGQFAGYVTQFKVEDEYIRQFEEHTVGGSQHQELWIPAEEIEEFNRHITGHIKVLEGHFGDEFQGFVPEQFGLQGKNAVEQFTLLANSYLYKRMDFYLEIRRNHKAVFLNYPFWQTYEFKNPGLKGKVLQAIKEAWFTSFPQTPLPLPLPVQEDTQLVEQTDPLPPEDNVDEEIMAVEYTDPQSLEDDVDEEITPVEQTDAHAYPLAAPVHENIPLIEQTPAHVQRLADPLDEDTAPVEQTKPEPLLEAGPEEVTPVKRRTAHAHFLGNPVRDDAAPAEQTNPHFSHGVELGLSGRYHEAIAEFSKALEEAPDHVAAHTSLGVAFQRLGEDERALACYETALRIDPIYAEAHYFRATILYNHGNVREAITGYTVAVGLDPELIEAHQKPVPQDRLTDYSPSPAEMYWIAKPAHRILDLNKTLEANPGQAHMQAYVFKARAVDYYRLRNYVQAIADYSSSLELQPDEASVLHSRGVAYEQLGQFDRALENYQQAIAINPQLVDVYLDRGVTFGNMGNFRQSIASLTESIRLAPKRPDGYFNRGTAYIQQGDFERAIEDFSNVIRLSPGDEEAYYRRGVSNEQAGRQGDSIADYRQFLALSQNANAREEIEQKLSQLQEGNRDSVSSRGVVPDDTQKLKQVPPPLGKPDQDLDLYGLIAALGERALHSTWFGSGVECYGEKADELYAFTDQDRLIEGSDFLAITSGIRQTVTGDFQAFDPGTASPWLFIRAWDGSGFYIETNDPEVKRQLKTRFQSVEDVDGASPPYDGLFLRI